MHGRFVLYRVASLPVPMALNRRRFLGAVGGGGTFVLAGCLDGGPLDAGDKGPGDGTGEGGDSGEGTDGPADESGGSDAASDGPPLADGDLYVGHPLTEIDESILSGGVSKDGIPSIDDPTFAPPSDVGLDDDDPVFGVVRDDRVRAYPQEVLVWHEIVNDTFGDESVAITYCPLTGTAQGFERGAVEFGVSGRLVNSNLVMYDRGTDTWWPQVIATGVRGPLRGETLREFRVIWTTWENWLAEHPDTEVLTRDTGYSRRYGPDPYGSYNPRRGYYDEDATMFSPLVEDPDVNNKAVVVGARTEAGAVAFNKERLLDERVLEGDVDGDDHLAVSDRALETGYVYANPDGVQVTPDGDGYAVDGEQYAPDELPLEQRLAFDAMYFAWYGFYPEMTYVG